MFEQIGAVLNQLMEALIAAGVPVDQIVDKLEPIISKVMEILGLIIGGIGG